MNAPSPKLSSAIGNQQSAIGKNRQPTAQTIVLHKMCAIRQCPKVAVVRKSEVGGRFSAGRLKLTPPNNTALFDAVLSAVGASNGAWLTDTNSADYSNDLNAALAIATEVDSLITPIVGGATISQRNLITQIVLGILKDDTPVGTSSSFYSAIANAIVAKFTSFAAQLQNTSTGSGGGSGTATAIATTGAPVVVSTGAPPTGAKEVLMTTDATDGEFQPITQDDILPGFAIASFTLTGTALPASVVEVGTTIGPVTAHATYTSGPPTSTTFSDNLGGVWTPGSPSYASASRAGTIQSPLDNTANNYTWTPQLSASLGSIGPKLTTSPVTWQPRVYHGGAAPGVYDATFIQNLASHNLQPNANVSYSESESGTEAPYYALPSSYAPPVFTIGGFSYPGVKVAAGVSIVENGVTQNYDLWQIVATLGLGTINVVVSH